MITPLGVQLRHAAGSLLRTTTPGTRFLRWRTRRRFWTAAASDAAQIAFYRNFFASGDLVFDVGANRGHRSRLFYMIGARVIAFEPQPALAAQLRGTFAGTPARIVEAAIGDVASAAMPMYVNKMDVLSTLSPEWISAMKRSERFRGMETWEDQRPIAVAVITFDDAIREHGVPVFAKIDVEGFELQVLKGLGMALRALSLEFAVETLETTKACVHRLAALGDYRFQISLGETLQFAVPDWLPAEGIISYFDATLGRQTGAWGDLYARLAIQPGSPRA